MPTSPRAAARNSASADFQAELGRQLVEVGLGLPFALQLAGDQAASLRQLLRLVLGGEPLLDLGPRARRRE
jgi:hypothetical protein